MQRTERILIKPGHSNFKACHRLCSQARKLGNCVVYALRQRFFAKESFFTRTELDKFVRTHSAEDYRAMPSAASAQRQVLIAFEQMKGWSKAMASYKQQPEKFQGNPNLPGYKKKYQNAAKESSNLVFSNVEDVCIFCSVTHRDDRDSPVFLLLLQDRPNAVRGMAGLVVRDAFGCPVVCHLVAAGMVGLVVGIVVTPNRCLGQGACNGGIGTFCADGRDQYRLLRFLYHTDQCRYFWVSARRYEGYFGDVVAGLAGNHLYALLGDTDDDSVFCVSFWTKQGDV